MIDVSILPDSIFYKALRHKDIIKCKILTDKEQEEYIEKANISRDKEILAKGIRGFQFLSRDELTKGYRNLDGSVIKLSGWHYNTIYTLCRDIKEDVAVVRIPTRRLKIKSRLKYCLLVFNVKDKVIDKSKFKVVSTVDDLILFRKTISLVSKPNLRLARQEIKAMKSNLNTGQSNGLKTGVNDIKEPYVNVVNSAHNINTSNTINNSIGKVPSIDSIDNRASLVRPMKSNDDASLANAPYTVTMVLFRKNNIGKDVRVGYRVKRKKDGIEKDLNLNLIKKFCINRYIDNMTIAVRQETGNEYFRGVGISLESLPSKYV